MTTNPPPLSSFWAVFHIWVLGLIFSIVADPDLDPYVFWPPGSGSISRRYVIGSGSGSFYHQAKIVSKTLIPTVLWLLYDFLSLKNDVNVASKSNKQKNFFCCHLERYWRKKQDPEPDPELDPNPDPLVTYLRIRTKMSRIRNTDF